MGRLDLTLGRIARVVRGTLIGPGDTLVEHVFIDSRETVRNGLFIALRGERFDGHDFATQAAANGAKAVLVQKQIDGLMVPHIMVADTLVALQTLAKWRRCEFGGKVAAITGSSGKTTTRRMLHAVLAAAGKTHQPVRNFNNHIGVPLSLLGLESDHVAAVFELGCSDFGEIGPLTDLVDPDVGLVTNVGPAHLEKLGSLDGVARAKGELFQTMRKDAIAVVNGDDPRVMGMALRPENRVVYGQGENAEIRLVERVSKGRDGQRIVLALGPDRVAILSRFIGAHNAINVTAAAAAATALNVDIDTIKNGLEAVAPKPGRLALLGGTHGETVIDDTYNANPASTKAAVQALCEARANGGTTIAVLGDMLELGDASSDAHRAVGRAVAEAGVDVLITLGEGAELMGESAGRGGTQVRVARTHGEAVSLVGELAGANTTVLVKGSRGMAMEKVVKQLTGGEV